MHADRRWLFVIFLSAFTAVAQENRLAKPPDASEKPSSVTGHVYLSDTKGPARKATIYLHAVTALEADTPPRRGSSSSGNDGEIESIGVQTRLDGSFTFDDVKPGNYYVIGIYPGYISPYLSLVLAKASSPYGDGQPLTPEQLAAEKSALDTIPRITVEPDRPASIDVTLERGAAISGRISFDDGNPAAGLQVTLLSQMLRDGKQTWSEIQPTRDSGFVQITTDDRGDYRFSGLPAGKYLVRMQLTQMKFVVRTTSGGSSSSGSSDDGGYNPITIYSGGTSNLHKAQSFELSLGDEHTGEDFRIPLSTFHTVAGTIVSANDGHAIHRGQVELISTDDNSSIGSANISEDNSEFTFHFVHDGDYQISSRMAIDIDPSALSQSDELSISAYDSPAVHLYGNATMPLHVAGDMNGVVLALPEPTPEELQAFKDAIHQQEPQNQTTANN